jgi:hypothetical protein
MMNCRTNLTKAFNVIHYRCNLLVLWLVGFLAECLFRIPRSGNVVHTLLVIVVILVILNLLGVI